MTSLEFRGTLGFGSTILVAWDRKVLECDKSCCTNLATERLREVWVSRPQESHICRKLTGLLYSYKVSCSNKSMSILGFGCRSGIATLSDPSRSAPHFAIIN